MAIDDLLDEHEQSERVRKWLKDNGAAVFGGIAVALALIFGWQYWQKRQLQQQQQAYLNYQSVVESLSAEGGLEKAKDVVAGLGSGGRVYDNLAALQLARAQVEAGKLDEAIATLGAAKPDPALKPLFDLRLARLLVETGKAEEAIQRLGDAQDPLSLEVRGDALAAADKPEAARDAYLKALTRLDVASPQRRLVELKLADAGGTLPKPADPV